jgi:hypothetical protein
MVPPLMPLTAATLEMLSAAGGFSHAAASAQSANPTNDRGDRGQIASNILSEKLQRMHERVKRY